MTVFLCFGDLDECCNCGGSATLGGTQDPYVNEHGNRFCSDDCREEAAEFNLRAAEARARQFACCPSCGFDNAEHNTDCPNGTTTTGAE